MTKRIVYALEVEDLPRLTAFWASALGYQTVSSDLRQSVLDATDGEGPELVLRAAGDSAEPGGSRTHLELRAEDLRAELERLEALGAARAGAVTVQAGRVAAVIVDPEGNELCVFEESRYGAGKLRLVADRSLVSEGDIVTLSLEGADPTRAVGGVVSTFEVQRGDVWEPLFRLLSPLPAAGADAEPTYEPVQQRRLVPSVGLTGPVRVVIPPVMPGEYRITRRLVERNESGRSSQVAVVHVDIQVM